MIKILIPIIALVASAVIFFGPTSNALDATTPLVERREELNTALDSAKKIQTVRESLQDRYNSFKTEDLNRLQKLLPSHVDNVRLVIDINNMAASYGMTLKNIEISQPTQSVQVPQSGVSTIAGDSADHLDIKFSLSGSYESLQLFLTDLGKSLRIVDVTSLSFSAKDTAIYDFTIGVRTYWLQDK